MNKIEFALLAFIGICGFGSWPAVVQDAPSQPTAEAGSAAGTSSDPQMTLLRENIRSIRKKLIAANLALTDSEAAKFWPVFEQYSAELANITDTKIALIKEYLEGYGTLTDEQADSLMRRWLDTDIATAQLRQKYLPILREVLPGMKAMAFFQLDRRISTIIDLQLTSQLPLAQQEVFSVPDTSPPSWPAATARDFICDSSSFVPSRKASVPRATNPEHATRLRQLLTKYFPRNELACFPGSNSV